MGLGGQMKRWVGGVERGYGLYFARGVKGRIMFGFPWGGGR
jgi:hypothetical protein